MSTKRWDFTVSSDDEGWCHATGYCSGFTHPDEVDRQSEERGWGKMRQEEREKTLLHQAKFHTDGHATAAEANACHEEYELDFELRFGENPDEMLKCAVCGDFTTGRVSLGEFRRYVMCTAHHTREEVAKVRDAERAARGL